MPVTAKKIGKKWRVVEIATDKIVTKNGKAVDGGGKSEEGAKAQAAAININYARKKGHRIPKK